MARVSPPERTRTCTHSFINALSGGYNSVYSQQEQSRHRCQVVVSERVVVVVVVVAGVVTVVVDVVVVEAVAIVVACFRLDR